MIFAISTGLQGVTTCNYRLVPALRLFWVVHSTRLKCSGSISIELVLLIAWICCVALPVCSSQMQVCQAFLANNMELETGSSFNVFRLVQITRRLCCEWSQSYWVLLVAWILPYCIAVPLLVSEWACKPFCTNNMEFQAGSSFASLFGGPYYKACMQWNGIYQAVAINHMDLLCCMAIPQFSPQACEAFLTKYMELQAGSSFTSLLCGP
jgi:hypothetical protein